MSYSCGESDCYGLVVSRHLIISHLKVADDHVAIGAGQVSKQRNFISRLRRGGEDTTNATQLLRELQRTQETLVEYRDGLRRILAQLNVAKAARMETVASE
jgi:hypothetical protein